MNMTWVTGSLSNEGWLAEEKYEVVKQFPGAKKSRVAHGTIYPLLLLSPWIMSLTIISDKKEKGPFAGTQIYIHGKTDLHMPNLKELIGLCDGEVPKLHYLINITFTHWSCYLCLFHTGDHHFS